MKKTRVQKSHATVPLSPGHFKESYQGQARYYYPDQFRGSNQVMPQLICTVGRYRSVYEVIRRSGYTKLIYPGLFMGGHPRYGPGLKLTPNLF